VTVIPTRTPLLLRVARTAGRPWLGIQRRAAQQRAHQRALRAKAQHWQGVPLVPDWRVPVDMGQLLAVLGAAAGLAALLALLTLCDAWALIGDALQHLARA